MMSTADDSLMWSINQVTDPSLSVTSETAEAVDALGSTIATFNRGKAAEFSANNSIFDLGLLAAQKGTDVKEATALATVSTPKFNTIAVVDSVTQYELAETPIEAPEKIYLLNGDGTLGTVFETAASPSSTIS